MYNTQKNSPEGAWQLISHPPFSTGGDSLGPDFTRAALPGTGGNRRNWYLRVAECVINRAVTVEYYAILESVARIKIYSRTRAKIAKTTPINFTISEWTAAAIQNCV